MKYLEVFTDCAVQSIGQALLGCLDAAANMIESIITGQHRAVQITDTQFISVHMKGGKNETQKKKRRKKQHYH